MTTFIEEMRVLANNQANIIEHMKKIKQKRFEKKRASVIDERFIFLTKKYYNAIGLEIYRTATTGRTEKYMNFEREDFKVNFPGLGNPAAFQQLWLEEICNPDSKYIPTNPETNEKIHFKGLEFDVWNNRAFTTVFSWK